MKKLNGYFLINPVLIGIVFMLAFGLLFHNIKEQVQSTSSFEEIVFATRKMPKDGHWYANFRYYSFDENNKLYEEESSLSKYNVKTDELTVLFKDEQGTFRDPQLHYDGKRIIFSYRKGGEEHFHLYKTDVNGSFLRQITSGSFLTNTV